MEPTLDEDDGTGTELVIGKTFGSGLKISVIKFDLSEFTGDQSDKNVWIYESNIFLKLKKDIEGNDPYKAQQTIIRPVNTVWSKISTDAGTLTNDDNLQPETGSFLTRYKEPKQDADVAADFTETIQKWVNPSGKEYNEENNGFALVSEYDDGSAERTNAKDTRYYSYDESLPQTDEYSPYIDICYKEVEVEKCEEGTEEVIIPVTDDVVIVKDGKTGDGSKNYNTKPLEVGTDLDDSKKRILVKFDVESFDSKKFDKNNITKAWVHLHFIDYSPGADSERSTRKFIVYKVIETWKETVATWDNAEKINKDSDPVTTSEVPEEQLGGTDYVIRVDSAIVDWVTNDEKNYGLVLIDENEDKSSRIPTFKDKDTTNKKGLPKPSLHICVPLKPETTPTTIPTTHTPSYTSTTSSSSTTSIPEIGNCTIPSGGKRLVINLEDYIRIQDSPTDDGSDTTSDSFIEIGKISTKGEKISLIYFDLEGALKDAGIEKTNVVVTDSKFNLRLTDIDDGTGDTAESSTWNSGRPILYQLKHYYNNESTWQQPWIQGDGPVRGVDYDYEATAEFNRLKRHPTTSYWAQSTLTQIVRYIFTQSSAYKKNNNGFVLRFVTDDNTLQPNHELRFASKNYPDEEFRPFMDICYLEVEPPIKCEDGELVRWELTADTTLMNDGTVHGYEGDLLIGNSGWAGEARALIDFDSSVIPDTLELFDKTQSVYIGLYYEGSEMAQPYNDPRQMNRTVAIYKMIRDWKEEYATGTKRTKQASWAQPLGSRNADFDGTKIVSKFRLNEEQTVGPYYWNITETFISWLADPTTDHGLMMKDNLHPKVPGHFLKFASRENSDPTKRPYLMACLKPQACEPVDYDPQEIVDEDECVSTTNITLNGCVAKNGGCSPDVASEYPDQIYPGTTAFWDDMHILRTFCRCCVDDTSKKITVTMDCFNSSKDKANYVKTLEYIESCKCQMCQDTNSQRKKREVPSKTRLLLRSALKSLLRK